MRKKFLIILFIAILIIVAVFFNGLFISSQNSKKIEVVKNGNVLGGFADISTLETPIPTEFIPTPTSIPPTTTPTLTPTPTPIEYKISFIDLTSELTEGGNATFTWTIDGPSTTFHKSVVYFGTMSNEGILKKDVAPADTKYTDSVKDFLTGDFVIPLRFIGNTTITKSGKYYVRVYALINSNNYWSQERSLIVNPLPSNEIKLLYYPQTVKYSENSTFTWELSGPKTNTSFTTIVGAKESKPGKLDESIELSKTPYIILIKDFTNGLYSIPLRFTGNTTMPEIGTFYIRAYAIINGKNIWSDEYTLTIQ